MIEDAMLFGLGFCAATLVALLCLPLVWSRARRLTRRRLEMLVPLSTSEIAAERDGLRARAAVDYLSLEQRLERAHLSVARVEVSLGRRTVELATAEAARTTLVDQHASTLAELDRTQVALSQAAVRTSTAETTVVNLRGTIEASDLERQRLEKRLDEAESLAESRRLTIASIEVRLAEAEAGAKAQRREAEAARSEHAQLRIASDDMARERDGARVDLLRAVEQRSMLHIQLKEENRRSEDNSVRLVAANQALARAERKLMEQELDLTASAKALGELKARFDRLEARLIEIGAADQSETLPEPELAGLRDALASVSDDAIRLLGPTRAAASSTAGAATSEGARRSGLLS